MRLSRIEWASKVSQIVGFREFEKFFGEDSIFAEDDCFKERVLPLGAGNSMGISLHSVGFVL